MSIPLLISHCKNLGASPLLAGLIGSTYGLIQFFSGPFMGKCSDNYGRKYLLQISFLLSAFSYFLLSISADLLFIFLSRIIAGSFKHTQEMARSFLAVSVKAQKRSEILGQFHAISNVGFILGPVVGGYFVEKLAGFYFVAGITSFLFLINLTIITLFLDKDKSTSKKRELDNPFSSFIQLLTLKLFRQLWIVLLVRFLMSFATFIYRFDPLAMHNVSTAGMLMSFSGVVSTISGFLVGSIINSYNGNDRTLVIHLSLIQGISILCLTLFPDVFLQMLFNIPFSIANSVARVAMLSMTLDIAKKKDAGVLIGLGSSTVAIGRFIAPLLGGGLQEISIFGPGMAGAFSSLLCAIIAASNYVSHKTSK